MKLITAVIAIKRKRKQAKEAKYGVQKKGNWMEKGLKKINKEYSQKLKNITQRCQANYDGRRTNQQKPKGRKTMEVQRANHHRL